MAGVALAEAQDVARLGAAEAVDELILVADRRQVAGGPGEQFEQRGLRLVGVLQLVDDQPAPARAQVGEPLRLLAQQPHREGEQVIERPRVAALELALTRPPHGGEQRAGRGRVWTVEGLRGQEPVLGLADVALELGCRGPAAAPERLGDLDAPAVCEQPVDDVAQVGLVVDRVALGAAERGGVLAQHARAQRVKRRGGDAARGLLAEQVGEPEPQLAGGAHAEGDGEDLPRRGAAAGQQVGDAVGQRARLAGAGPGHQQQRSAAVAYGGGLLGRQPGGDRLGPRVGRARVGDTRGGVGHASPPG